MVRLSARAALPALLALLAVAGPLAAPAAAHRDGCHRWHSCPSDSGSYVCGDLGYYSECPGGAPEAPVVPEEPEAPVVYDFTAPSAPALGARTVRAGQVRVMVRAERGSRLVVTADYATVIARFTATGSRQLLQFRGRDGTHTYDVTATDGSGNESSAASFTAAVDATAPRAPKVAPAVPGARGGYTVIEVRGEHGTRYSLRVASRGRPVADLGRDGTLDSSGTARLELLVPNGSYLATVRLRDADGNRSKTTVTRLRVAVPAPDLTAKLAGPPSAPVVTLTGPALGTGYVTYAAEEHAPVRMPFALDGAGTATVTATLPDGRWTASASVTDYQRRRATTRIGGLTVDTAAPEVSVTMDRRAARHQEISLVVTAAADATTTVSGLPGGPVTFTTAGEHPLRMRAKDGRYDVRVESVDAAGNRTVRDLAVSVSHPLTAGELVVGLGVLALFALAAFAVAWLGWRERERLARGYWAARAAAARRTLTRQHRAQVAAHQRAVGEQQRARTAYADAHARWQRAAESLARDVAAAESFTGTDEPFPVPITLRPGERTYAFVADAGMVEYRRPNGYDVATLVDRGSVLVTDRRVVFAGSKRREWLFDQLTDLRHLGTDQTIMTVVNRQKPSGVAYAGAPAVRFRLDLARAAATGTRDRLVARLRHEQAAHAATQPRPPAPTPPAPLAPVLPTAEGLRAQAAQRRAVRSGAAATWPPAG